MKLLLLCLGLTLVCAQEGTSDVIAGEWYSILLASDHREKIEENGSMRVFVEHIDVLENSSLSFKFHTKNSEPCSVFSTDDGNNKFRILQVNYSHHIIFYLENFSDSYQLLELYGRNEFVEICQKYGIVKENVIDLTKVDRCFQARGNGVA
uniref:Lipocalin/cytosolic fatty-acid binding domain-containing protein n=1 Tax=Capra hircus TaxID=9925 RepID=A0A452EHR9_CAPHI